MKYDEYEVDEFGRALVCPTCDNEDLFYDGDKCRMCDEQVVNKCANTKFKNKAGWDYTSPSCESFLSGNARYCNHCGNESTFYQEGILEDWLEEYNTKRVSSYSEIEVILYKE